jgi:clan AA aspartic protease (TIGR02281 family)
VVIFRPQVVNRIDYRADALGHVVLTAMVNRAPIRFLVDTGANRVCLTPADARAAGVRSDELVFNQTVQTANGPAQAAFAVLREMRIDQLEVNNAPDRGQFRFRGLRPCRRDLGDDVLGQCVGIAVDVPKCERLRA